MAVDLEKIELGAGELIIFHFLNNQTLFWDDPDFVWDSGQYWPDEWEIGAGGSESCVEVEVSGKKIFKDISIGRARVEVKSAVIGAEGEMKVKMIESVMNTLVISMGGDPEDITTDATSEKYVFGGSAKQVVFGMRYTVSHLDDANKKDVLTLYRGIPSDMAPIPFVKSEERVWEVTFKLQGEKEKNWSLGEFVIEK